MNPWRRPRLAHAGIAGSLALCGLAIAARAADPALLALDQIQPGQWQVKEAGSDAPGRTLCIGNTASLVQFGRGTAQCRHYVIANEASMVTVHFTCTGSGHGQTTIKVSTPRAFNLSTQGIMGGTPFDEQYEARRMGACPPGAATLR